MSNQSLKRKGKENETSDESSLYSECNRLTHQERKKLETAEKHSEGLAKAREHMRKKRRCILEPTEQENNDIIIESEILPKNTLYVQQLSDFDIKLLKKFRTEMNNCAHHFCPTCKERFPSITLVIGDVPEELKCLTEIEEMLIAQIFPVVSVYYLRSGQYAYRGNVINFPQDVQEFVTRLLRHPSSLEILIVCRQSSRDQHSFKDFNVCRAKIEQALYWLKSNNRYYTNIEIDYNNEDIEFLDVDDDHINNNTEDIIMRNFVPTPAPSYNEEYAINNTLCQMQTEHDPILWPTIKGNPVNEFNTPRYIACTFPTLYPTGDADLRAEHAKDIKPAEYFKHLLKYKDGRFGRYTRWRYFALNSQMRWKALQKGRIYIKQSQNSMQLTVEEVQELANSDNHLADKIICFGEDLRGT
ncbi:19013_t:CDS:2 [Cetraspora pellucida]|uniref:19013_t:CDS:1 n=1 Tax=Cetraspora pellucida TaxID=1433469 RepID=A0A9N9EWS6_9GLOM|nr:19013_t:CDS:2 [Cetraspora pellucida]